MEHGNEYVHGILREKDPQSAEKLHYNDVKRVIRAIEIYETTGKPKSLQQDQLIPRFDFLSVSIEYPREALYERINLRVEQMFTEGLLEEVRGLLDRGITQDMQCMQGIGYKEVVEGLRIGATEEEIKELVKKNTRNYAKRQQTFFKKFQNHVYLSPNQAKVEEIERML